MCGYVPVKYQILSITVPVTATPAHPLFPSTHLPDEAKFFLQQRDAPQLAFPH
jgi:hypothetical protein